MKRGYMLIICLGMATLLFGADTAQRKAKQARLSQMKMGDVVTADGFEYFSGHLDTSEIPSNFLTIYLYRNMGDAPKLKITGNGVSIDFSASQIDHALEVYKLLVLQKTTSDEKERARLSQQLEKYFKLK